MAQSEVHSLKVRSNELDTTYCPSEERKTPLDLSFAGSVKQWEKMIWGQGQRWTSHERDGLDVNATSFPGSLLPVGENPGNEFDANEGEQ